VNHVIILLGLVVFATLTSFLLSSTQRRGYGLVSGTEFIVVGAFIGPAALDFLTSGVLQAADAAVAAGVGWLGFRFGLRFRRSDLARLTRRQVAAIVVEPLVSSAVLFALLRGASYLFGLGLSLQLCIGLAAIGSASTKSALQWAVDRYAARGSLTDLLCAVARYDDWLGLLLIGGLLALGYDYPAELNPTWKLAATLLAGPVFALFAFALLGRGKLREDLTWIAVLGFSALGTGLAMQLGLSSLAVAGIWGAALGLVHPAADALDKLTEPTERPIVQVLLLLVGARLELDGRAIVLAIFFVALRLAAKLVGGTVLRLLAPRGAARWIGAGLLPSGGMAGVMALSLVPIFDGESLVLWSFAISSLVGDLVGSRTLRALLARAGEITLNERAPLVRGEAG